jgi:very-short-patch-repair endonuclease
LGRLTTCTIHGDFSQIASKHLNGAGCSKCNGGMTYNKEFFIEKANEVHVNKYDYSKVTYTKGTEEVIIICPVHGQFKQKPEYHLSGNGCHKCRSSKAERKIIKKLKSYKIKFDHTYTINIENRNLYCDIFLKEYKLIIEYDGPQHFIPVPFSGKKDPNKTIENFYNTVERDNLKNKFAETNKYKIIRIPYWIYEVSIIKDLFENDKINEYSKIYSLENNRKYFILNQKKLIQKVPGFTKHISPFFDLTKLEQIFKV